jgi:hypothetical protein
MAVVHSFVLHEVLHGPRDDMGVSELDKLAAKITHGADVGGKGVVVEPAAWRLEAAQVLIYESREAAGLGEALAFSKPCLGDVALKEGLDGQSRGLDPGLVRRR